MNHSVSNLCESYPHRALLLTREAPSMRVQPKLSQLSAEVCQLQVAGLGLGKKFSNGLWTFFPNFGAHLRRREGLPFRCTPVTVAEPGMLSKPSLYIPGAIGMRHVELHDWQHPCVLRGCGQ